MTDEILSVDTRKLRQLGRSVGMSLDIDALRDLGLVDDDELVSDQITGKQTITADGTVEIELDLDGASQK